MSLNLEEKQAVVAEVSARLRAQAIIIAEYRGLGVGHMTELRAKERAAIGHLSPGPQEYAGAPRSRGYAVYRTFRKNGRSAGLWHRQAIR